MIAPSDGSVDVVRMQLQLLRKKSPSERAALAIWLSSDIVRASKRAMARAHPELTPRQAGHLFVELHYGRALADAVRRHDRLLDNGRTE